MVPKGLLEPVWCKNAKWIITAAATMNGRRKWMVKNRVRVALSTANPPQIHCTNRVPRYGMADNRLVITVAPQNDICPQGNTYPINAAPITRNRMMTPTFQVSWSRNEW